MYWFLKILFLIKFEFQNGSIELQIGRIELLNAKIMLCNFNIKLKKGQELPKCKYQ